jgi:tripartite-type tricarboxylate transporter receptor subunit TctC
METTLFKTVAIAAALVGSAGMATAQSAADFYKDKQVTILIGYGVGGTYGKYSTILAQQLKPVIGAKSVIVQSMPGSGGLRMTNYAYNVALKDGSVIMMPPDTLVVTQLMKPKAAKYDASKLTWLGSAIQANAAVGVRADSGVHSIQDAMKKEVAMASSGIGSQTYLVPQLANALIGTKFKIVKGYKGSRKMQLAMEQNEVQGISLTWLAWKTNRLDWYKKGFAKIILQMGPTDDPALPGVPQLSSMVDPSDKPIVAFMSTMAPIGRGLAMPPGVPQDRIAFLRAAFKQAVTNSDFAASAKKRKLEVSYSSGETVQKIVNESLKIDPKLVKRAQILLFGKAS